MEYTTAKDYRLNTFMDHFAGLAGKKIFLYGTGINARAVIEQYDQHFHFAGLIDQARTGECLYGKTVVPLSQAAGTVIIMCAQVFAAEEIYRCIHAFCRENNVQLYDMYGLDEISLHDELQQHVYLGLSEWKAKTEPYDIVSFAVADTFADRDPFQENHLTVRPVFRILCEELISRGKQVVFTANRYYPVSPQLEVLKEHGIPEADFYPSQEGELVFPRIREARGGGKMLHVGTNLLEDSIMPRLYGIDTYRMVYHNDKAFRRRETERQMWSCPDGGAGEERKAGILKEIDRADVISFDVFDTLIMRKTLYPEDVFYLTAQRCGLEQVEFCRKRKEAEHAFRQGTIHDIYSFLQKQYGWDDGQTEDVKQAELKTEQLVAVVRPGQLELFRYALAQGKRVYLLSDMYLPEQIMSEILMQAGICGYTKLFVSCDYGMSKQDGLFELLKQAEPDAVCLHIGDSPENDLVPAQRAGIRAVHIPAARDLAASDGLDLSRFVPLTPSEKALLGLLIETGYADPFRSENNIYSLNGYAWMALGPVLLGYISWLKDELSGSNFNKVLFVSRDGWLVKQLYDKYREYEPGLPEPMYFYTSRKSAFQPNMATDGWMMQMAVRGENMQPEEIMENLFGLESGDIMPYSYENHDSILAYIRAHADAVRKKAAEARKNYLLYMENSGLKADGIYAFADLVAAGFTQNMLEHFVLFRLRGLYLGRREMESEILSDIDDYFGGQQSFVTKHFMDIEVFMTSPEPSVDGFDSAGHPVFEKEQRNMAEIESVRRVHEDILRLMEEWLDLCGGTIEPVRSRLADRLYELYGKQTFGIRFYDSWIKREM
ncbi:MAG: hypothetical protein IJL95_02950 [Solobacterium sp.]|nr:hypothetical protein [Solobacterium sp.]